MRGCRARAGEGEQRDAERAHGGEALLGSTRHRAEDHCLEARVELGVPLAGRREGPCGDGAEEQKERLALEGPLARRALVQRYAQGILVALRVCGVRAGHLLRDMYSGVPSIAAVSVRRIAACVSTIREMPKSSTLGTSVDRECARGSGSRV